MDASNMLRLALHSRPKTGTNFVGPAFLVLSRCSLVLQILPSSASQLAVESTLESVPGSKIPQQMADGYSLLSTV